MATYERRCDPDTGGCGKWALVDGLAGSCPVCRQPFPTRLRLGDDKFVDAPKEELVDPRTAGRKKTPVVKFEEPKAPLPQPGEEGYRPPSPRRQS